MAYNQDLTKSGYSSEETEALSVGFLDAGHKFIRGPVPVEILYEIGELVKKPYIQHRGYHVCELCVPTEEIRANADYLQAWSGPRSGSSIIRVIGNGDINYVAPSLLVHYITDHQYRPPTEFLEAIVGQSLTSYIEKINGTFVRSKNKFQAV